MPSNSRLQAHGFGTIPMIGGKKIIVVLPAYRSSRTLERTVAEITPGVADEIILVDDASKNATVETARRLGLKVSFMNKIVATAPTRRPAIARRSSSAPTSS